MPSVEDAWQATDYLPDLASADWREQLDVFRRDAAALPDDLLVVLVGDMVTEEALPSYSMALNELVRDAEGTGQTPWARWLRGWTAEENRHGDLLNVYLRLSGRVDMRAIERTIQGLLASGFTAGTGGDPYGLLVYTAFQERATCLSHARVGRLAADSGADRLARMCRVIAGDEARHETFYTRMMARVLDIDPDGGLRAVASMLARQVTMPGRRMCDGRDLHLFDHFATVAQRLAVYTSHDYAAIIDHLVDAWRIAERTVAGEAARVQEQLCSSAERYHRLADRLTASIAARPKVAFSWIQGREA